jgi:hypothetical protein
VFGRATELREIRALLRTDPVVTILGPRQIGKTTLAREIARTWPAPTTTFDLEDPRDIARLADPTTTLGPLRGLVVIDDQRRPDSPGAARPPRGRRPARLLARRPRCSSSHPSRWLGALRTSSCRDSA